MSDSDPGDRRGTLWSTMNLEMKIRVWVTALAITLLLLLGAFPNAPLPDDLILIPFFVFVYWVLRHLLGVLLVIVGLTRNTGSLFEHCMNYGMERSWLLRNGTLALGVGLLIYAMFFDETGPPWP